MRFKGWMKIMSKMYHPLNIYSTFTVTWQGVATVTVRAHTAAAAHVHSQAAPSPDLAKQYFPHVCCWFALHPFACNWGMGHDHNIQ